jgi:hypothetical protein
LSKDQSRDISGIRESNDIFNGQINGLGNRNSSNDGGSYYLREGGHESTITGSKV